MTMPIPFSFDSTALPGGDQPPTLPELFPAYIFKFRKVNTVFKEAASRKLRTSRRI
jgi:hypothetical protein